MKQKVDFFNDIETYMIGLLRYGVLDERPEQLLPSSEVDWDKMMDIAASQGILAWVWDGICKLPKENQPSRLYSINWGLSAQEIWDRYAYQKKVLLEIIDICNQNHIRLLLFKGIALSELFPNPHSRPSGDIDFYLFEDYRKGNVLFAKDNISRSNKRTGFDYKGVHIENHRIFLNAYTKIHINAIKYLESSLDDVSLTKDGYYIMSPTACIVYQVMHFLAHLDDISNPLSLRFIVDFGVTMNQYQTQVSAESLKPILKQLKITDVFCLLLSVVETEFGLSFDNYNYMRIDKRDSQAIIDLIYSREGDCDMLNQKKFFDRAKVYCLQYKQHDRLYKYLPKSRVAYVRAYLHDLFSVSVRKMLRIPDNTTYVGYFKKLVGKKHD